MGVTSLARSKRSFSPRTRLTGGVVLSLVALYLILRFSLPGHLPLGIIVQGLVLGALSGLVAIGLVLIYRSARIVNFAQGQMGALGVSAAIIAVTAYHVNFFLSLVIGVAVSLVIGFLVDALIYWRFKDSPRLIVTVVTIGLAEILGAAAIVAPEPFHLSALTNFRTPFTTSFTIAPLTFNGNYIFAMIVVAAIVVGLWFFLSRTDTGAAIRAAADSSERALLLGIPVRRLSRIAWMVAAALSGIGLMLQAPIVGASVGSAIAGPSSLIAPLAAAVFAGMDSLPVAFGASLVIGVFEQAVFWSYPHSSWVNFGLFVLILIGLVVQPYLVRSGRSRVDDSGLGDYVAVREVRPLPKAWASMKEVRIGKPVLIGLVLIAALFGPLALSASNVTLLSVIVIYGLIGISLVVLTGWAGQISLGQFAFVGVGAAATGALLVHAHVELLLALVVSAVVGSLLALVVGIPALRVRGLYLAVTTLAFASMTSTWLLSASNFPVLNPQDVHRPLLLGRFNLSDPVTFYELCLLILIGIYVLARNLRKTRTGRAIVAIRDNARGAASYSISPLRAKLVAFAFAGAIAGIAGGLYVVQLRGVGYAGFPSEQSVVVFTMVVIGGLGSLPGAIAGAAFVEGLTYFAPGAWQLLGTGAGLVVILMLLPEGLGGLIYWARDKIVRWLATREHLQDRENWLERDEDLSIDIQPGQEGALQRAALRMEALEGLESVRSQDTFEDSDANSAKQAVLACRGIDAGYGSLQILFDVDLSIRQGEVLALLGTNGAGKSTVLKVLSGILPARNGRVYLTGEDITNLDPVERVKRGLVTVPGGRGVFPSLTVEENIRLASWLTRKSDPAFVQSAQERVYQLFPGLLQRRTTKAGELSGGEQQMLTLAQALLCKPKILLIDELSLGLSPVVVDQLLNVVRSLASVGMTVVVVEQSVNVASALAHRAIFMERGRVRFSGPTPTLEQQPQLLRSVFLRAATRARKKATQPDQDAIANALAGLGGPSSVGNGSLAMGFPSPLAGSNGGSHPGVLGGNGHGLNGGFGPVPPGGAGPFALSPTGPSPTSGLQAPGLPTSGLQAPGLGPLGQNGFTEGPRGLSVALDVPAFSVTGVSRHFGGVAALTGVDMAVYQGEILGIIGANGAGKTTLFDVCSGFLRADTGRIFLRGRNITEMSANERAALGLGRVFQDCRLFPSMTVTEALATAFERFVPVRDPLAEALDLQDVRRSEREIKEKVQQMLEEMGLVAWRNSFVSELSMGTKRVLELACVLAHDPHVVLLDEPASSIAQRESEALGELLLGIRDQTNAAFMIIEHDVPLVASISDRMICMHLGRVISQGYVEDVLNDPAVIAAYLGTNKEAIMRSEGVPEEVGV